MTIENFEQSNNENLNYDILKKQLLTGIKSPKEIRLLLLNADQSNGTHDAANENLIFLQDDEVKNFFYQHSQETQEGYDKFLGFTQWHIAQNLMFEDKTEEGLELFRKSVENSIKGNSEESWVAYGQGTIAYLEKNIDVLRESIQKVTSSLKNKVILERMLARIENGQDPDYKLDY